MLKAVLPGSFDPVTFGHLDIIERASKITDQLIVLVAHNSLKKSIFTLEERIAHLKYLTKHLTNVSIESENCLAVDYAWKNGANVLLKGLRNSRDYDYELQIAEANKTAHSQIETVFITTKPEYAYLSSTVVKEFFSYGGNIEKMVPYYIIERLNEK